MITPPWLCIRTKNTSHVNPHWTTSQLGWHTIYNSGYHSVENLRPEIIIPVLQEEWNR